jgi:hypothetical protein
MPNFPACRVLANTSAGREKINSQISNNEYLRTAKSGDMNKV